MVGTDDDGNNKYVLFTNGNLQYDIASSKYQLASAQWEYLNKDQYYPHVSGGTDDGLYTSIENDYITAPSVIDLFGWGTGTNPTYASMTNSNYSTFNDWGTKAKEDISYLGDARTLTKSEWASLLNNQYIAMVKLTDGNFSGNVIGLVVFPYDATQDEANGYITDSKVLDKNSVPTARSEKVECTMANMTVENLEKSGALFLPAGGRRQMLDSKYYIKSGNEYGMYWSSNKFTSMSSIDESAFLVWFQDKRIRAAYTNNKCKGYSVRLVKDAE